jgi:branched-chain amino acid aminotransferase
MLSSVDPEREGKKIRAKITSIRRTPPQCLDPKVKNLNYANQVLAKIEVINAGADEAIFLDLEGYINEATAYSIFMVKDSRLYTPSAENILNSITRDTVFEIAGEQGIGVKEGRFVPYDLYTADEVFFAATAGGIIPIAEVDGRQVGEGKLGPVTKRVTKAYWDMLETGVHGTPYKWG